MRVGSTAPRPSNDSLVMSSRDLVEPRSAARAQAKAPKASPLVRRRIAAMQNMQTVVGGEQACVGTQRETGCRFRGESRTLFSKLLCGLNQQAVGVCTGAAAREQTAGGVSGKQAGIRKAKLHQDVLPQRRTETRQLVRANIAVTGPPVRELVGAAERTPQSRRRLCTSAVTETTTQSCTRTYLQYHSRLHNRQQRVDGAWQTAHVGMQEKPSGYDAANSSTLCHSAHYHVPVFIERRCHPRTRTSQTAARDCASPLPHAHRPVRGRAATADWIPLTPPAPPPRRALPSAPWLSCAFYRETPCWCCCTRFGW